MAFKPGNLLQISPLNQAGPYIFKYTTTDTVATVSTGTYFQMFANQNSQNLLPFPISVYDMIFAICSDGEVWLKVSAINPIVTVIDYAEILPGSIVNADINAAAAIAFSKLAALPSAQILIGSAGNVPTATAVTGDIGITNGGVTSITAGAVVDADINAAAAIAFSKLEALPSAEIIVGSAGNVPTAVAMTGDIAIDNAGVTTIQAGAVDLAMLSAGITPSHVVKFAGQLTTVGGAAAEAFAVAGVLATDLAFVQMVSQGTAVVTALIAVCTIDTLTVTFSGDPGNDAVLNYQILRAAV